MDAEREEASRRRSIEVLPNIEGCGTTEVRARRLVAAAIEDRLIQPAMLPRALAHARRDPDGFAEFCRVAYQAARLAATVDP